MIFKIEPESTSVAKAIKSSVKAKEEADRAEQLVNDAVADINSARDTALSQISTAETNAVTAVNDARDAGVIAVQDARDQGVGAIETARTNAVNAINSLVSQAEAFKDDAENQAQSEVPFTDSEGNNFDKGAKGYAGDASTSASTATTQAGIATTQAGNASTSAGEALTQANRSETEADRSEGNADIVTEGIAQLGLTTFDHLEYYKYASPLLASIQQPFSAKKQFDKDGLVIPGTFVYSASGALNLDGRRIDTIIPLTTSNALGDKNATNAGNNRAINHKTIDGFSQYCVERTSANLIAEANQKFAGDWFFDSETTGTVTQDKTIQGVTSEATEINMELGTVSSVQGLRLNIPAVTSGDQRTFSMVVKNTGNENIYVYLRRFENAGGFAQSDPVLPGESKLLELSSTAAGSGSSYILISSVGINDGKKIKGLFYQPMFQEGLYATLFSVGTALPSAPVFSTALPAEGANVIVIDAVATGSANDPIIQQDGINIAHNCRFDNNVSERLRLILTGKGSGLDINQSGVLPSTGNRFKCIIAISYSATEGRLYVMLENGNIYRDSESADYSYSGQSAVLGCRGGGKDLQSSQRYESYWQLNHTINDDNVKDVFERISVGTSIETKAEDMTLL